MNNNKDQTTICITGGHLSPALAVIEEIALQHKSWKIMFVGRKQTSLDTTFQADEQRIIETLHIPFYPITTGRMKRYLSISTVIELLSFPIGCIQASLLCIQKKPDCILSFGGYVSLPMVIAGWLFGIPIVIHEQTHELGLANRIAAQVATFILVTFPETKHLQGKENVIVTGLPIRKAFFSPNKEPSFSFSKEKQILYITGGTTGSITLNQLIFPLVEGLVSSFVVIHQTGQASYESAQLVKKQLPEKYQNNYIPLSFIESEDVAWIMHHMTLLIGRSGANTTMEVASLHKPAVFIPLPWGGHNEQLHNALWYSRIGQVTIIDQQKTTSEQLLKAIQKMLHEVTSKTTQRIIPSRASSSIVKIVNSLLHIP